VSFARPASTLAGSTTAVRWPPCLGEIAPRFSSLTNCLLRHRMLPGFLGQLNEEALLA